MHNRAYLKGFVQAAGLLLLCVCLTATVALALAIPPPCFGAVDAGTLPEIRDYRVTPSGIDRSDSAIISWDVENAASVNIDHGIGEVPAAGQAAVSPLYSTTYKLTAVNSVGIRTRFITLDVVIPQQAAADMVNVDPVTGRNASVDMRWEDYCYSSKYQVQIARDSLFTLKVYDSGVLEPADSTAPAFWVPPGAFEAGHTYYWRVRTTQAVTGQRIASPWSDAMPFTVKPGYAVSTASYGLQAFSPANGATGCQVSSLAFSWSGYQGTTKYRFILARDAQLQNIVVEDFTTTTSYTLPVKLNYDTGYFWQAAAVEPVPGDAGSIFTFSTESAPATNSPAASSTGNVPGWAIAVIVIGVLLVVIVTVAAFKAGRKI